MKTQIDPLAMSLAQLKATYRELKADEDNLNRLRYELGADHAPTTKELAEIDALYSQISSSTRYCQMRGIATALKEHVAKHIRNEDQLAFEPNQFYLVENKLGKVKELSVFLVDTFGNRPLGFPQLTYVRAKVWLIKDV